MPCTVVLLLVLGNLGQGAGRQMKLTQLRHTERNAGANEWWDAVTGADEYGAVFDGRYRGGGVVHDSGE